MKTHKLLAVLAGGFATVASAQTPIDAIQLTGDTLTTLESGAETYDSLIAPSSFVDLKDATDYIHSGATEPASLAAAIGSFDISSGSLNHPLQVQFGETLFGTTLVYLIVNEADETVADTATIYPIDAAGNRLGDVSASLNFPGFGTMPALDVREYQRTTDGAPNGTLDRTLTGVVFTLDDLGIGGLAGTEGLEVATGTLDPQEIGLARAGSLTDPTLLQDVTTADPDLDFGTTFEVGGAPADLPTRTVRFVNGGPGQSMQIDDVTITDGFEIAEIGRNGTGGQEVPFTLEVGDSIEVSVDATPSGTGPEPTLGTLTIDAAEDSGDRTLAASAVVLGAGDRMNPNPNFLAGGGTGTGWSGGHVRVSPGLTPGSGNAARIVGQGDPGDGTIGNAGQTAAIPDGAGDFEAVFLFAPVDSFTPYTGAEADGEFTDRSMQYLLLATDTTVDAGAGITDEDSENILVNLAYMPDGAVSGGTPGFYIFDGTSDTWELALAAELDGSIDSDTDGVLDPAAGDTVEAYRVSVLGSGFGTAGASYEIRVATVGDTGLTDMLSSGALTGWHGTSGETGTLAAHAFTTADRSESNTQSAFITPFWVDFSAIYHDSQPGEVLSVVSAPPPLVTDGDVSPVASGDVTVRHDGAGSDLEITALNFDDPAFSGAGDLPLTLAPGTSATLDMEWDSGESAPRTAARTVGEVAGSASSAPATFPLVAGVTSSEARNPNFDFEVPGDDPGGDDPFLFWNDGADVRPVPGLVAGSDTAARVNGGTTMGTTYVADSPYWSAGAAWTAEAVFAIGGTENRIFNFKVREELGGEPYTEINIRYEASVWQVFNGIPGDGGEWVDLVDLSASPLEVSVDNDGNGSLDDPGDVKIPYRLRVSGRGWDGGSDPVFDFEVMDASGATLGSATGRTEFLTEFVVDEVTRDGPNYLELRNSGAEFWVDDVVIASVATDPGVRVMSVSGGPDGFTILYDAGGEAVSIERSFPGLDDFEEIATGETSGSFTDESAPSGAAFYRVSLAE